MSADAPKPADFAAPGGWTAPGQGPRANCNRSSGLVGAGGVRAFAVTTRYWSPPYTGIYAATSAAKTKFKAWIGAQDAGWYSMKFGDLSVRRAPEFDCITSQLKHGVDREYACLLRQKGGGGAELGERNGAPSNGAEPFAAAHG